MHFVLSLVPPGKSCQPAWSGLSLALVKLKFSDKIVWYPAQTHANEENDTTKHAVGGKFTLNNWPGLAEVWTVNAVLLTPPPFPVYPTPPPPTPPSFQKEWADLALCDERRTELLVIMNSVKSWFSVYGPVYVLFCFVSCVLCQTWSSICTWSLQWFITWQVVI